MDVTLKQIKELDFSVKRNKKVDAIELKRKGRALTKAQGELLAALLELNDRGKGQAFDRDTIASALKIKGGHLRPYEIKILKRLSNDGFIMAQRVNLKAPQRGQKYVYWFESEVAECLTQFRSK